MEIVGIDAVRYGVDDIDAARRFFTDFGLTEREHGATGARFTSLENSEVELRLERDAGLPAGVVKGPTIREVIWAVASDKALDAIGAELEKDRKVSRDPDGTLHSTDCFGYGIGFRKDRRIPVPVSPPAHNYYGSGHRVDRGVDYSVVFPIRHIGHAVFFVPDLDQGREFYTKRLGFRVTDRYQGFGNFMRAEGTPEHHTLFHVGVKPNWGAHHVAFEVGDFHEIMVMGKRMQKDGWKTEVGPGRHIIGSNYFWYFKSPCGSMAEFYADIDHVTDAWKPRDWQPSPELIACWMVNAEPELTVHRRSSVEGSEAQR